MGGSVQTQSRTPQAQELAAPSVRGADRITVGAVGPGGVRDTRELGFSDGKLRSLKHGDITWSVPPDASTVSLSSQGCSFRDGTGSLYEVLPDGTFRITGKDGRPEGLQYARGLAVHSAVRDPANPDRITSFTLFDARTSETKCYTRTGDQEWQVRDGFGRPVGQGAWKGDIQLSGDTFSILNLSGATSEPWKHYRSNGTTALGYAENHLVELDRHGRTAAASVEGRRYLEVGERSATFEWRGTAVTLARSAPGAEWRFEKAPPGIDTAGAHHIEIRDDGLLRFRDRFGKEQVLLPDGTRTVNITRGSDARTFVYLPDGSSSPAAERPAFLVERGKNLPIDGIEVEARSDGAAVIKGEGREIELTADFSRIERSTDASGRMRVDKVTYAGGAVRELAYAGDGSLEQIRDFTADGKQVRAIAGADVARVDPNGHVVLRPGASAPSSTRPPAVQSPTVDALAQQPAERESARQPTSAQPQPVPSQATPQTRPDLQPQQYAYGPSASPSVGIISAVAGLSAAPVSQASPYYGLLEHGRAQGLHAVLREMRSTTEGQFAVFQTERMIGTDPFGRPIMQPVGEPIFVRRDRPDYYLARDAALAGAFSAQMSAPHAAQTGYVPQQQAPAAYYVPPAGSAAPGWEQYQAPQQQYLEPHHGRGLFRLFRR